MSFLSEIFFNEEYLHICKMVQITWTNLPLDQYSFYSHSSNALNEKNSSLLSVNVFPTPPITISKYLLVEYLRTLNSTWWIDCEEIVLSAVIDTYFDINGAWKVRNDRWLYDDLDTTSLGIRYELEIKYPDGWMDGILLNYVL